MIYRYSEVQRRPSDYEETLDAFGYVYVDNDYIPGEYICWRYDHRTLKDQVLIREYRKYVHTEYEESDTYWETEFYGGDGETPEQLYEHLSKHRQLLPNQE